MVPKQKFFEIVFQILYSQNFLEQDQKDIIELIMRLLKVSKSAVLQAYSYTQKVQEKQDEMDSYIQELSVAYQFDRISDVEKNILRLGIYAILYDEQLPDRIAIAESIRLCRKFGTRESAKFVHALLGAFMTKYKHS